MPKTCPICGTTYPDTNQFCPADGTTLRSDESDADLIGSVIADRYLISKLLGEGGMGRVYLASHVRLPQQAAIKVLHPSMVQDSAAVARFNREASSAAKIEHDRVARVFDFGETSNGLVYLAMEFVPGRTLRSILEETPRLTPTRAANLIYQVAEGLDAAHRMSIVHRDLKPDNIMVITDDTGLDRSKVVDFGIAKVVDGTPGQRTQLTQAGSVIGTPEFMSPEQVFGEALDARSDVYALALVGYQMLTGQLPFDSSTPERSLTARIVSDPRTLLDAAPDVAWPPALQDAFTRALAREPDARTASALDFADAVVAATEAWTGTPVLRGRTPLSNPALLTAASATPLASIAIPAPGAASPAGGKSAAKAAPVGPASPGVGSNTGVGDVVLAKPKRGGSRGVLFGALGVVTIGVVAVVVLKGGGGPGGSAAADSAAAAAALPVTGVNGGSGPAVQAPPTGARTAQGTGAAERQAPSSPTSAPTSGAGSTTPPVATTGIGQPTALDANAAEVAKLTLDQVKKSLADAEDADAPAAGRAAIPRLLQALPYLLTVKDSTDALVFLAQAYSASDDQIRACVTLRAAKRQAKSDAQLRMVTFLANSPAFQSCP